MKNRFSKPVAALLIISLVAPTAFFAIPQRASAAGGGFGCLIGGLIGAGGLMTKLAAVPVSDLVTQGATTGQCFNDTILLPLARALARLLLAQITATIIGWINGNNGTGQPSYVQSLSVHLQNVGDNQANAFFAQFEQLSISPFAAAITSSLRTNYYENTSAAGFFAANQCPLYSSGNADNFIAGDWSQGGVSSWLALTTQTPCNPYTLQQAAQSQLASVVGGAAAARAAELGWGQGFLSWCGPAQPDDPKTGRVGTAPGDTCKNSDGTPGTIKTPGSMIHGLSQRAVDATGLDWLLSAQDLDAALGAISMALVGQVLGGIGGLFGASDSPSSGGSTVAIRLQTYSANNAIGASSAVSAVDAKISSISVYTSSWNTLISAANTASTTVANLASYCLMAAETSTDPSFAATATAQASAAQTAITTEIAPVISQGQAAINSVADTQTFALQVEAEAAASSAISTTTGSASTLSADMDALFAMPPSGDDITSVQQETQATGRAVAIPVGSLTVSGGTITDRMSLIATNAAALKSSCTATQTQSEGAAI